MTQKVEQKQIQKTPHCLTLDNRKKLILSGVAEVDNYDEKEITAYTDLGELSIKGENLNIKKLNLEFGDLEVEGKISSLAYYGEKSKNSNGFWKKLLSR